MKVYEGNGWKVINGRWQDSPPEQVDHVISDPPYDERTHEGGRRQGRVIAPGIREILPTAMSFPPLDIAADLPGLLQRARRWIVCFGTGESIAKFRDVSGDLWVRWGVWIKSNMQPQLSGDRPAVPGDAVMIMHAKGRKKWNRGGMSAKWIGPLEQGLDRVHETQKPLWLMQELIEAFTDPGDLVWDPYGGSMTTGVACLMLGRRFLGHEMQEHYAEVGAERLRAAEQGLTLTAARAGQLPLFGGTK